MQYQVLVVGDDELPAGMTHVIVERTNGEAVMLISGLPGRVWKFMRAWEDLYDAPTAPTVLRLAIPRQPPALQTATVGGRPSLGRTGS